MPKYFTHYWKNDTWKKNKDWSIKSNPISHTGGNVFDKLGLEIGDHVYIISVFHGKLFLAGKLVVGMFCNQTQAEKVMGCVPGELWQADQHLIASESTIPKWDLAVPQSITQNLQFLSNGKIRKVIFETANILDRQTLRGTRQLTEASATSLDDILLKNNLRLITQVQYSNWLTGTNEEIDSEMLESRPEGNAKKRFTTRYERDGKLRKQAIALHGLRCKVCSMNFAERYGIHGDGFIHVHHLEPLSQFEGPREVNPRTDLTVLCANCHAMIHRNKDKTLTIDELKSILHA